LRRSQINVPRDRQIRELSHLNVELKVEADWSFEEVVLRSSNTSGFSFRLRNNSLANDVCRQAMKNLDPDVVFATSQVDPIEN
jgi:hypothetical protein